MQERDISTVLIMDCLSGIEFPSTRKEMVQHARQMGCREDVLLFLEEIPDRKYSSIADVMIGIGQVE
jgi:hypothetical protein